MVRGNQHYWRRLLIVAISIRLVAVVKIYMKYIRRNLHWGIYPFVVAAENFEWVFLRSETFYQFASHIDLIEDPRRYNAFGGKSLHHQSHGESFLALFMNRFKGKAIYLLDEPEAALSPTRQLSLLKIMKDLEHEAQFIIATHSPILLGYPNATIYSFDQGEIESIRYEDTIHYIVTKRFWMHHSRY